MPTRNRQFVRFLDLKYSHINCDLHVHTSQTDGRHTAEEIMTRAMELGLAEVGFTEHVRRDTDWFDTFATNVRTTAEKFPQIRVLVGCEVKALDTAGVIDVSSSVLGECDFVVGSIHRFPDGRGGVLDFAAMPEQELALREFELAKGLLESAPIDVLGHPGGMYSRRYGKFPRELMRELLDVSLIRGIAIEINSSYLKDFAGFLELCGEVNPFVSIGSDVHQLPQLGSCRDELVRKGVGLN